MINIQKLLSREGQNDGIYGEILAHGIHSTGAEYAIFRRHPDTYLTTRIGYVIDEIEGLEYTNTTTGKQVQLRIRQFFLIDLDDQTFTASLHLKSYNLPATYHEFLNCLMCNDYYQFHEHDWQDVREVFASEEDLEYSVKRLTDKELIGWFENQVCKVGKKEFKENIFDPIVLDNYIESFYESEEFTTAEEQALIKSRIRVAA
jgi:hypothetical protein